MLRSSKTQNVSMGVGIHGSDEVTLGRAVSGEYWGPEVYGQLNELACRSVDGSVD